MRKIQRFFDYLFKWKFGIVLQIAVTVFAGLRYKIDTGDIAVFLFVGVVCYTGATLFGLAILYSWIGIFKKDGRKFIALYRERWTKNGSLCGA